MLPPNSYFIPLSNHLTDPQEGANKEQNVTDPILAFHGAPTGSPGCGPLGDQLLPHVIYCVSSPQMPPLLSTPPSTLLDPAPMPASW